MGATIDVVAKENVIEISDISVFIGTVPDVEEAHQVMVITVEVSKDLDRRLQILDQSWLSHEHLLALVNQLEHLISLDSERLELLLSFLSFLRLEKIFDEDGVEALILVLLNDRCFDVGSKFLGLFLQLVNGDLSDEK